jgi:L-serine deaminase
MPEPTQNRPENSGEEHHETSSDESFDKEEFDPEEAERRITQFVTSAGKLSGPPVKELAEQVATLMRSAWSDLEEVMAGKAHNKVLATQLLLGQRARGLQPHGPEQWRLHAATSLLSWIVVRNVEH